MIAILGRLADVERDHIRRTRTAEGRSRAQKRRPLKLTPHQKREAIKRRDTGEEFPCGPIDRSYNVSAATISRLAV